MAPGTLVEDLAPALRREYFTVSAGAFFHGGRHAECRRVAGDRHHTFGRMLAQQLGDEHLDPGYIRTPSQETVGVGAREMADGSFVLF